MRSPESCFDILAREVVPGGHSSATKEKLRIADGELTVLLKRTSRTEVVALRAANQVLGATAIPQLIHSGRDSDGDWIAIPFYAGHAPPTESAIPDNVVDSLAALHAHYLHSEPLETMRAIEATWWMASCAQRRLRQLNRAALRRIVDTVQSWSTHPLILDSLGNLPRTLLHGDVHRNNVVVAQHTGSLVDWGGAAYGFPLLDVVTVGASGSRGYERYAATWRTLTGGSTTSSAWRRGYLTAIVCSKVQYLAFAARHFGDDAAIRMFDTARRALVELERLAGS